MNPARYKSYIDGEEKLLFDEVSVMLYHLFDRNWFGKYFESIDAVKWVNRERLE
jgi:hypothetical protein